MPATPKPDFSHEPEDDLMDLLADKEKENEALVALEQLHGRRLRARVTRMLKTWSKGGPRRKEPAEEIRRIEAAAAARGESADAALDDYLAAGRHEDHVAARRSLVGPPVYSADLVEDIVVDVQMELVKYVRTGRYDRSGNFQALMNQIAFSFTRRHVARQRRAMPAETGDAPDPRRPGMPVPEDDADFIPTRHDGTEDAEENARLAGKALDNLERLDPAHRDAFRLVKIEGLTYAEAAARLGRPEGTVKRHVGEARNLLAGMDGVDRRANVRRKGPKRKRRRGPADGPTS